MTEVVTGTFGKIQYVARITVVNFDKKKAQEVFAKHESAEFAAHLDRLDREEEKAG